MKLSVTQDMLLTGPPHGREHGEQGKGPAVVEIRNPPDSVEELGGGF